jgi:hypothetical protein
VRQRITQEVRRRAGRRAIRRWVIFATAGVTGLLCGALLFEPLLARLTPRRFALESVFVIGAQRVSVEELVGISGVDAGTSLVALDTAQISERVTSHPWIAEARVTAFPPHKLLVAVVEREAAAIAELGAPPLPWLVDAQGTPFAPASVLDREIHPIIFGVADAQPGHAHPLLAQGVDITRAVAARGLPVAQGVQVGDGDRNAIPELRLGPRERQVVLGGGDLEAKLDRLSWILKADLPELGAASSIDLRFGNRVILRSGPSPTGDEATGPIGREGPSDTRRAG